MQTQRRNALLSLVALVAFLGVALFACAGTIAYWQAWVYLGTFALASLLITLYLEKNDPALLERRMRGGPIAEDSPSQKVIQSLASAGFIALLCLPALDARFRWSHVPLFTIVAGDIFTALSFYSIFLVFKENTFTSAAINIAQDQRVISTGPYAIVRHPMYASAVLLFIGTPVALGSYWGILVSVAMLPVLGWRLLDEEKFLATHLPGYVDYCKKVRWRLIPGLF